MNLQTVGAFSTVVVIQAVTLRQEVLDRACRRGEGRTSRFVDGVRLEQAKEALLARARPAC
jgi:hypothetical protein